MTRQCSDHVFNELAGRFTRAEADKIVERLSDRLRKEIEATGKRADELAGKLAREATAEEIIAYAADRRLRLHALGARLSREEFYRRYVAEGGDEADALRVINVGKVPGFAISSDSP